MRSAGSTANLALANVGLNIVFEQNDAN